MSRIVWDAAGDRLYETGISQGILYPKTGESGAYSSGVAWNGLSSVSESPDGAEANPIYADNMKYLNLTSVENFKATIEAYTYPDEFAQCDGSASISLGVMIGQQPRKEFGLCYKTKIGNDTDGAEHGYKLHIVYGALAAPSEKAYATVNDSPEAITFSWEISTTPVPVSAISGVSYQPTASMVIDSTKVPAAALAAIEDKLYGTNASAQGVTPAVTATEPTLVLPDEIIALITAATGGSGN